MEGVEPGLKTGREPQESFPAKPELQLDGLAGPGIRHVTAGRELDRCRDHRPEVPKGEAGIRIASGERPVRDWVLAGIAPSAQLFQAPRDPLLTPLVIPAGHVLSPLHVDWGCRSAQGVAAA